MALDLMVRPILTAFGDEDADGMIAPNLLLSVLPLDQTTRLCQDEEVEDRGGDTEE